MPIRYSAKSQPIAVSYLQNQVTVHPLSLPAGAAIKQETFKYTMALRGKINRWFPFPSRCLGSPGSGCLPRALPLGPQCGARPWE